MDIRTAADICRPLDKRTFQDQTLDLADKLIGEERQKEAREMREANVSPDYRVAACELDRLAINLKAYCRGMVSKHVVPAYIKEAREALDRMEGAL